jgi:hypothetical protein
VSSVASSGHRAADRFGRTAAVLAVLGVLVAVGLSLPKAWFEDVFSKDPAAGGPTYTQLEPSEPVRVSAGTALVAPLIATDVEPRASLDLPPIDAPLVSWWDGSALPGSPKGQTVLTARSNGEEGALTSIGGLHRGDAVDLLTGTGTMRYEVDRIRTLTPEKMSRADITLLKQDGGAGRLVMISQEGWDGAAYARSVVVTAYPLGQPEQPAQAS